MYGFSEHQSINFECLKVFFLGNKVWIRKNRTDILLNITKVIAPTVKTQARGQNDWSRALK